MAAEVVEHGGPARSSAVTLACASIMRAQAVKAEAVMLRDLARWAVLRTAEIELPLAPLPGEDRAVRAGGSGTPRIAESLFAEVSAEMGLGPTAAHRLLADALTLVHRMPRLMGLLERGTVDVWRVRLAASTGRALSRQGCARLEDYLVTPACEGAQPPVTTLNRRRLTMLLEQLQITDQPDAGETATQTALAARYVRIQHATDGTADLTGRLSTGDAERLDAVLDQMAAHLATGEDDDRPLDVRRSVALGALGRGQAPPPVTLFVHLDQDTGTWNADDVGAITQTTAGELMRAASVTVAPAIDLASDLTCTGYVASDRLRTQVALTQRGTCAFPHCDRPTTHCVRLDHDHRIPYTDGGPTSAANGQLLCRYHHRVKTHARWKVRSLGPGSTEWTTPTGQRYVVRAGHTERLRT